jgi:hypothetical protein
LRRKGKNQARGARRKAQGKGKYRSRRLTLETRYFFHASFQGTSGALYLDLFEQPVEIGFFRSL